MLFLITLKMKIKNRSHRYDMIGLFMDTNTLNLKRFSVWWCLYVLSNNDDAYIY